MNLILNRVSQPGVSHIGGCTALSSTAIPSIFSRQPFANAFMNINS